MTFIKKTNARGRNMPRVCYLTGHGLNNQRYGSFWEFWQARGLSGDHKSVRTELFENADEANVQGYQVRMVYAVDDNNK